MRILWLVLFVLFFDHLEVFAQGEIQESSLTKISQEGNPFIRNYSPKEYGAFDQNMGVVTDSLGLLYFANGDGVLTYDGVDWRVLPLPNDGNVISIEKDDSGRIYVGGLSEFGYLRPDSYGRLEYVSLVPFLNDEHLDFKYIRNICTK